MIRGWEEVGVSVWIDRRLQRGVVRSCQQLALDKKNTGSDERHLYISDITEANLGSRRMQAVLASV